MLAEMEKKNLQVVTEPHKETPAFLYRLPVVKTVKGPQ